jgi:[acyl-carrier-protein] S-malonyltransferase
MVKLSLISLERSFIRLIEETMTSTLAFVFPGQGSQRLGMLADIASQYPQIENTFKEASTVLGYDLWQLVQTGPVEQLNLTEFTQPALLVAGVAIYRVWQEREGAMPRLMAGHSLGEYAALVAAESLHFLDAVRLVQLRGQLMQAAVPDGIGGMGAIVGLDNAVVEAICDEVSKGQFIAPGNYNSLGQVVVTGHKSAVERALALALEKGASIAVMLPMSIPAHCELMREASHELAAHLNKTEIKSPKFKVIHNVDVASHANPDEIRQALVEQLYSPVRWVETIQAMRADGIETIVECGPGNVLAGLIRRIDRGIKTVSAEKPEQLF